jgi:predicted metal-dependent hydrolase
MGWAEVMRATNHHQIELGGHRVEYRLVASRTARKLRLRVGPNGIDVVRPINRTEGDVLTFLEGNKEWLFDQLRRVDQFQKVRVPDRRQGEILFRGAPTRIRIEGTADKSRGNLVHWANGEILIKRPAGSQTPVSRSLEHWLRHQARAEIEKHLKAVTSRLRQGPRRIYVMGQRTKWGNCSAGRNLSFNWRLILAPEFVLRYLVTHEAVHLAVPNHSAKFWLTVQSLCPETEKAKRWLSANGTKLMVKLEQVIHADRSHDVRPTTLS